jgi:Transcription factor COE1 helix-loop-helix domain
LIQRQPGDPDQLPREILFKRAADIVEASVVHENPGNIYLKISKNF